MKNIVLTGFAASGKTTCGKICAKKLGFTFSDTDKLVENNAKMSINEIFEKFGEEFFRDLETDAIKKCAAKENQVIACGGGAVLRKENMEYLSKNGIIVNLNPTENVILKRFAAANKSRPLMKSDGEEGTLYRFRSRQPYYDVCDYKIEIDDSKDAKQIADEILAIYKKEEK